jgi:transcriptional regulator with XRE-family HTH domain
MTLGERIKILQETHGVSNKAIADLLHVADNTVSGYVHNKSEMTFDSLVKLADLFEVSTDYLLGRTDIPDVPLRLSDSERRLILDLRTLRPDQKAVAAQTVRFMAEQNRR